MKTGSDKPRFIDWGTDQEGDAEGGPQDGALVAFLIDQARADSRKRRVGLAISPEGHPKDEGHRAASHPLFHLGGNGSVERGRGWDRTSDLPRVKRALSR